MPAPETALHLSDRPAGIPGRQTKGTSNQYDSRREDLLISKAVYGDQHVRAAPSFRNIHRRTDRPQDTSHCQHPEQQGIEQGGPVDAIPWC